MCPSAWRPPPSTPLHLPSPSVSSVFPLSQNGCTPYLHVTVSLEPWSSARAMGLSGRAFGPALRAALVHAHVRLRVPGAAFHLGTASWPVPWSASLGSRVVTSVPGSCGLAPGPVRTHSCLVTAGSFGRVLVAGTGALKSPQGCSLPALCQPQLMARGPAGLRGILSVTA